MARKKLTARNARKVLDAVLAMDKADRDEVLTSWNQALDDLRAEDFFGTEAQNDPRGDGRE
jgi:hypothetical protein